MKIEELKVGTTWRIGHSTGSAVYLVDAEDIALNQQEAYTYTGSIRLLVLLFVERERAGRWARRIIYTQEVLDSMEGWHTIEAFTS